MDYPLHPPLSSVPITLLVLTLLLDVAHVFLPRGGLANTARVLLVLAALSTLMAFFSGYPASDLANQTFLVPDDAISLHHTSGRLLLLLVGPCLAWRWLSERATHARALFTAGYAMLLTLCVCLALYTGHLGGDLVFTHGAGVKASVPAPMSR